jgi:hypothetical protein
LACWNLRESLATPCLRRADFELLIKSLLNRKATVRESTAQSRKIRSRAQTLVRSGPTPARNSSNGKEIASEAWPPAGEWTRRQEALKNANFRRLGLGPERVSGSSFFVSQVLEVLGPGTFAEFTAVRTPGKLLWCNFELARQLGFAVPRSNQPTPEFEAQLLSALSLKSVATKTVAGQETVTMYADKYGGDGVLPALGAGRAGFLSYGNLYVKGMGFTPLFKHNDPNDFAHSHGAVHLDDCLCEAVFGEVNENLFARGASRVVAVIDQGKDVVAPGGRRIPVALVVRAGSQLRPAHLLAAHIRPRRSRLDRFVSIVRASGQLVTRVDKQQNEFPDLHATMLRIVDDHARTAAEGFRWRMIHGALSASNMEWSGAMLDLPTQSTQPRTAPVRSLDYADSTFGTEHFERARRLATVYQALVRSVPAAQRAQLNVRPLDIGFEMRAAYERHLQVKLLSAIGLKTELAQRLQVDQPELASRFTDLIRELVALKNPGTIDTWKSVVETVSIVDIFYLLQNLPPVYFATSSVDLTAKIHELLRPVFRGNRFHIAKKRLLVETLVRQFAELYEEIMSASARYAVEYYGDLRRMQVSLTARAAFENAPLDYLYAKRLRAELCEAIAAYRSSGNAAIVREALDQRIVASLRSVDSLLAQGAARRLAGGVEIELRTIAGINYSVRAWNDVAQTRRLHVSIPAETKGDHYVTAVTGLGRLTRQQVATLRYRFTTDSGKTFSEVGARLVRHAFDGLILDFEDLPVSQPVGRLDGAFYFAANSRRGARRKTSRIGGYVFAIPDKQELIAMASADSQIDR